MYFEGLINKIQTDILPYFISQIQVRKTIRQLYQMEK